MLGSFSGNIEVLCLKRNTATAAQLSLDVWGFAVPSESHLLHVVREYEKPFMTLSMVESVDPDTKIRSLKIKSP